MTTSTPEKKSERGSTMVVKKPVEFASLTEANLNKIDSKAKRSMLGSSLINAAVNDVQRVNKIKSEYNSGPGNFIKAG